MRWNVPRETRVQAMAFRKGYGPTHSPREPDDSEIGSALSAGGGCVLVRFFLPECVCPSGPCLGSALRRLLAAAGRGTCGAGSPRPVSASSSSWSEGAAAPSASSEMLLGGSGCDCWRDASLAGVSGWFAGFLRIGKGRHLGVGSASWIVSRGDCVSVRLLLNELLLIFVFKYGLF